MADAPETTENATGMQDVAADGFTSPGDRKQLIESPDGDSFDSAGQEASPLQLESHGTSQSSKKTSEGLKLIIISSIVFAIAVTVALVLTIFLAPPQVEPHGAVATASTECSKLGTDILKKGGSAVDATVTTALCIGVVHPPLSGIGGGGFMIVRQHKEKKTTVFNFRETAPKNATENMLNDYTYDPESKLTDGRVVGVPGFLQGLEAAHKAHGKLEWKELVEPVAHLARNGFQISDMMGLMLEKDLLSYGDIPTLDEVFFSGPNQESKQTGDNTTWPDMAKLLDRVAIEGADVIKKGDLAKEIQDAVQENGGVLSTADLEDYEVLETDPLVSTFLDMSVETVPAPSLGPILILLLNIMEGYYKTNKHEKTQNQTLTSDDPYLNIHRFLEASKFGTGHESMFGDLFGENKEIVLNHTRLVMKKSYADELRQKIDDNSTFEKAYYEWNPPIDHGTSQISVIGPNEDHVSTTLSLNNMYGSRIATKSGILLNNEMLDFETDNSNQDSYNLIAGGKRPLSHMVPTIIHSQDRPCGLRVAIGGSNGSRITTGVAEVILKIFAEHKSLSEAVDAPRLYPSFDGDMDVVEYDVYEDPKLQDYLNSKGRPVTFIRDKLVSLVQAVAKMNETMQGRADIRANASASVY